MPKSLKERLLEFVAYEGLSKSEFERLCGLSNGFVDKSSSKTRRSSLDRISNKFPNLNIDWVITGIGDMIKSEATYKNISGNIISGDSMNIRNVNMVKGDNNAIESNVKPGSVFVREDLVDVPFVSRQATASFIESCCDYNYETLETIAVPGITKEDLRRYKYIVFEILGNSMFPTIKDSTKILAKYVDPGNWEYITGVYVVCYRDFLVAKRIMKNDLILTGTLTLHSDNPQSGETTIRKDDIRGMWEAISTLYQKIE